MLFQWGALAAANVSLWMALPLADPRTFHHWRIRLWRKVRSYEGWQKKPCSTGFSGEVIPKIQIPCPVPRAFVDWCFANASGLQLSRSGAVATRDLWQRYGAQT